MATPATPQRFVPDRCRRASVYFMVLGTSMIVTLIGVSALLAVRARNDGIHDGTDFVAARYLAQAAIDRGLHLMQSNPDDWRGTYASGVWLSNVALGKGSFDLRGLDPEDNDLADSKADTLLLIGTGKCGKAQYHLQVVLVPPVEPLEALETCLHSGGNIDVDWDVPVTISGGTLSANGELHNRGYITGDIEVGGGWTMHDITGEVTSPAPDKDLPESDTVNEYVALATAIPFTGNISRFVLTAALNPWGTPNPNGVYYIDTGGSNIQIAAARVEGTLIIRTRGGVARIDQQVLFHTGSNKYPVLIVDGDAEFAFVSQNRLYESWWSVNYNPPDSPYKGNADKDMTDDYPNGLLGLAHVTGNLDCVAECDVRGTIICEGSVYIGQRLTITHEPSVSAEPPPHYSGYGTPVTVPGSWQQTLLP